MYALDITNDQSWTITSATISNYYSNQYSSQTLLQDKRSAGQILASVGFTGLDSYREILKQKALAGAFAVIGRGIGLAL